MVPRNDHCASWVSQCLCSDLWGKKWNYYFYCKGCALNWENLKLSGYHASQPTKNPGQVGITLMSYLWVDKVIIFTGELKKENIRALSSGFISSSQKAIYQQSRVLSNISLSKNDFGAQSKLTWYKILSVTFYLNGSHYDSKDNKYQQFALSTIISLYFLYFSSLVFLPFAQAIWQRMCTFSSLFIAQSLR